MRFKKKCFFYFSTLFVFLFAGYFTLRIFVQNYIETKIRNFSLKGLCIEFKKIQIKGCSVIQLTDLTLITPQQDTLFKTSDLRVEISTWKLVNKEIDIKSITVQNSNINLHKDSANCNYCFLLNNPAISTNNHPNHVPNYSDKTYRIGKIAFNLIPEQLELSKFNIYHSCNNRKTRISITNATIINGVVNAQITTTSDSTSQNINISGLLSKDERLLSGTIINNNPEKAFSIPFIKAEFNALVHLTKIDFKLSFPELSKSHSIANIELGLTDVSAFQSSLADTTIRIPQLKTDLFIDLSINKIKIKPSSYIRIGTLSIHPEIHLEKNKSWKISLLIDEKNLDTNALIEALPDGLFGPVKSIKTEGHIDYRFLLDVNLEQADSLIIESELIKKDFRITNPGILARMNNSFLYTAYEEGKPVRSFIIGPENSQFTPTSAVSPLLINAILQSEDGQFFFHNGFRIDAIREALIHDIKAKKFARGGSTISMQIVKNVFLNRNKNIARKLEEAMIVWLIESNKITSKQRMFDVYINIIEWGPNVYGVSEATQYYFKKTPSELTLDEAIFMASIIPHPKRLFWSLDKAGNIRESQFGHFRIVKNRLIRNGIIEEDSTSEYIPRIAITGNARLLMEKERAPTEGNTNNQRDSIPIDNLLFFHEKPDK